jgi:hypothetical protein
MPLHPGKANTKVTKAKQKIKKTSGCFFVTFSFTFVAFVFAFPGLLDGYYCVASDLGKTSALNSAPMSTTIETR